MASALGPGTSRPAVSPDDSFQAVLLELSGAAAQGLEFEAMLHLFCRIAQEHFQVSTVFCWLVKGRELFGLGGAGIDIGNYLGKRIPLDANTYSGRAVRDRVTVLVNDVPAQPDEIAKRRPVESILAVPLVLGGPVIGVIVMSHMTEKHFFTEELVGKSQILATLLGNLIETARLNRASREERRRAEALTRCARALHSKVELESVSQELVHGVCDLLLAQATALLLFADKQFRLASVFSPDGKLAERIETHHTGEICPAAAELARRAVAKQDIVMMAPSMVTDAAVHVAERQMVAIPLFTTSSTAVLFVYPAEGKELDEQELSLLRTVAGFGAMAVSNA